MGIPGAMMGFLQRKYDLMAQNADAETLRAKSLSNLEGVRAGLLPSMTQSDIAKNAAAIAGMNAETAGTLEQNKFIPDFARSTLDLNAANAYQSRGSGAAAYAQGAQLDRGAKPSWAIPFRFSDTPDFQRARPGVGDMLRGGYPRPSADDKPRY